MLGPKRNDAGKKKMLCRMEGKPDEVQNFGQPEGAHVFQTQKRSSGRRSSLKGVEIAMIPVFLLYTLAGVSYKKRPIVKLDVCKIKIFQVLAVPLQVSLFGSALLGGSPTRSCLSAAWRKVRKKKPHQPRTFG